MDKKVTITDIANSLGVSSVSVHRALSGKEGVSEKLRERILKKADELGYETNYFAASLTRKTAHIAVVLPHDSGLYFELMQKGILAKAAEVQQLNIEVTQLPCADEDEQYKILKEIADSGQYAGVITLSYTRNPKVLLMLQALVAKRITTIVIDDQIELIDGLYCISANEKTFGQIAAQFISLIIPKSGIVLVTRGRKDSVLHSNKLKSFKAYMKDHCPGIRVEEIGTYYEKYSQEAEHKMTKEIETRLEEERDIRAVFALTSHENQAVTQAVIQTGRREDVRTVGTDLNVETVKLLEEEKLDAVINQGARYKGYLAMEEMVDCVIKNKEPQNRANCPIDIVLKSNLALYCATNSIS